MDVNRACLQYSVWNPDLAHVPSWCWCSAEPLGHITATRLHNVCNLINYEVQEIYYFPLVIKNELLCTVHRKTLVRLHILFESAPKLTPNLLPGKQKSSVSKKKLNKLISVRSWTGLSENVSTQLQLQNILTPGFWHKTDTTTKQYMFLTDNSPLCCKAFSIRAPNELTTKQFARCSLRSCSETSEMFKPYI